MEGVDLVIARGNVLLENAHGDVDTHLSEGVELLDYLGFVFILFLLFFFFEFYEKFGLGFFDSLFKEFGQAKFISGIFFGT